MRHGSQARRMRGRNNHNNHSNSNHGNPRRNYQNKNRVFDSNGPDVRIRGTAFQIVEKYAALAKDASATGDWVLAESYLQHAEHYQRMIGTWAEEEAQDNPFAADMDDGEFDRFGPVQTQGAQTQSAQTQSAQATIQPVDDLALPASILGSRKSAEMADA
jgi:hypothetical protein